MINKLLSSGWTGLVVLVLILTACVPAAHPSDVATPAASSFHPTTEAAPTPKSSSTLRSASPSPIGGETPTPTPTFLTTPTPDVTPAVEPTPSDSPAPTLPWEKTLRGQVFFAGSGQYGVIDFGNLEDRWPEILYSCGSESVGPCDAVNLAFAHHAEMMAFWDSGSPARLWISDLSLEEVALILDDVDDDYSSAQVLWTPDDSHIILETTGRSESPSLIYHVQRKILEPWPWDCDRIASSPLTKRLALWCPSASGGETYAVVEWKGEIWVSNQPPTDLLVVQADDSPWVWAWSVTGDQVAFYDISDPLGHLFICDAQGTCSKILPGTSLLSTEPSRLKSFYAKISYPVQWSRDSRWLLVYSNGSTDRPCPKRLSQVDGVSLLDAPCWQVVEVATGEIAWTPLDSFSADDGAITWLLFSPSFSPTGSKLAFGVQYGGPIELWVVDLGTKEGKMIWDPRVLRFHWANSQ